MNVSQLMSRNVVACRPDHTLDCAAKKMWEHDIGCVVVVNDEQRPVGMLTDRDVCMAAYTQGKALAGMTAASAMSREVFTCLPSDAVIEVEEIMRSRQVRRMPVVDGEGRAVGVVSLNDLVREAAREQGRKGRQISAEEMTATLAAISQPRPPIAMALVI